jgi:hypothetical protein
MDLSDSALIELICWFLFILGMIFFFIGKSLINSSDPDKSKHGRNLIIAGVFFILPLCVRQFWYIWLR